MRKSLRRPLSAVSLLALAAVVGGCATSTPPLASAPRFVDADGATWAGDALRAPVAAPQDDEVMASMDQVHPRTMLTFSLGLGEQTNEINTGNTGVGVITQANDAQQFRFRGEHVFESGFGGFAEFYGGFADDIAQDSQFADSSQDTFGLFIAGVYRATLSDSFRLPVRLGVFSHMTDSDATNSTIFFDTATERTTTGIALSAEPEYIIFQRNNGGKISELSAFGEFRVGAGPTNVKNTSGSATGPFSLDEDAYAFLLNYEIGLRYRFAFGLLTSLSYLASKYHVGTSESYSGGVIFGVDDDFNGIMLTAGMRF